MGIRTEQASLFRCDGWPGLIMPYCWISTGMFFIGCLHTTSSDLFVICDSFVLSLTFKSQFSLYIDMSGDFRNTLVVRSLSR